MKQIEYLSKKKEVQIHMVLFLFLLYLRYVHLNINAPYFIDFTEFSLFGITFNIVFLSVFYFHYFLIMPRWVKSFNWKTALIGWASSYLLFVFLRALLEQWLTRLLWDTVNYHVGTGIPFYFFDNFYFSIIPIFTATVTYIVIHFIRSIQLNQLIESKQKETELRFLKSQINPHFIFNTLNNIYYLVYRKSELALPAIDKLSHLMRYMTYETEQNSVELQKELNYIQDFIDLEKMRIAGNAQLELIINVKNPDIHIPPLLLLPFVENGFKHGVLTDKERPFIIQITQKDNILRLHTQNKINKHFKDSISGIGLSNIRKRLELQFPDKHNLTVTEEANIFTCELTIEL
ncbi:sensor histidine kinase [Myroides guanonis]|uniref:Histidine kinase n=1 Tax=Myroides guanonis TaxID=1150112 RepID=A0A1I3LIS0_9FLAO|nr:histidine kinase [Myroides guanonis]SFI84648.1 Histidine kinase [Myroides guanonis]